jgi:DNA-nicking Smr family endonuclease
MKSNRQPTYRPFEELKTLLKNQTFFAAPKTKAPAKQDADKGVKIEDEHLLFSRAMEGVEPLVKEHLIVLGNDAPARDWPGDDPDEEALSRLKELVRYGDGFIVSDTSEYMEGIGYGVPPEVARRLHRGDFSIQGHIDLHGYVVEQAKQAFEAFLKESIEAQRRAVLIIHGRGLSSRDRPIIKAKVKTWLTSGPWRKWVLAFTSARTCDGGAGATYVLLRKRPATKRYRKIHGVL